ncbi:MAG: hypothetical protein ABL921_31335 [Pirellula sp.]
MNRFSVRNRMSQVQLAALSGVLEEEFYRERDRELLDFLESDTSETSVRQRLSDVSGILDTKVLDDLTRLGITVESFTALMLLPLVRIAWADGWIQEDERAAILKAAEAENILKGTANYQLLDGWLFERPESKLLEAWTEYAKAVSRTLDTASLEALRKSTLERVHRIADTSGGILGLGIGNRITKNEELALLDIERAFAKQASE